MNIVCFNAVRFSVEFIKLFLAVVVFFKIRQHKSIYAAFLVSLFMLTFASLFFDVSKYSVIYGIVAIVLLSVNAYEKKKAGMIVLSYLGICIIDMIFASVCIAVFRLDIHRIQENPWLDIGLNLFSLFLLLLGSFILYTRQVEHRQIRIKKYIAVYLIGGVSLSLYLTSVQFMGMGESPSVYRNNLVIGMSLSSLVLVVLCVLLIINNNRNEFLKREVRVNEELLGAQKEYYAMLLEKERETRAFRHDIRNHLYCMQNLYNHKEYEELGEYLVSMGESVEELSSGIQTGNDLVTAIVNDITRKYPEVHLHWTGMIPDGLRISSLDICTIFYNLLFNAFEAVQKVQEGEVVVNIKSMESTILVTIMNPIHEEPKIVKGEFVSSKAEDGHGYGIRNIKKCIEKNEGMYSAVCDNGFFITEIMIPKVFGKMG